MKSQKSLRPMPPLAHRSLKLKLVRLKENLLMCADMMWDFLPAERSENRVTDTNRFFGLNQRPGEVPLEAIPIAVIHTN